MLPKIECSDELLLGILNQDSGRSTELGLQHLNNCEHCQARIEELAANKQQWALAREGLCSRVEGGFELDDIFKITTHPLSDTDRTSHWTDAVAKQLLQPPSHPEMLGRLGRYEIERLVGSGGMGVVFKAYDSELHRSVAIKMLAPHLSGSRSARERFAREARAAAAIVNDHVVPIHNVETEHATPYLVMQYIAGDSLQARLDRDGPLDVCEILRIGMQVATGLAAAHAQGLIHRDVKPSNIMLDENVARALLTDFGLARAQNEACLTRSGFHPGTPHYMSPEQVRGEELDGRSDLFSLGCVLYALCTGHPPYRADSGYAVMRRITDDQPRSIRDQNALIPEWLERVVMRLLEKDRESRFQSAEELAQILEQCLAHVQKPATEPLPLAVVPKASFFDRGRIRNWILAGMASAFLFFAGVFIVLETNKGTITIKSEADNVPIRIKRSDKVVDEMLVSRTGKSVRLAAGEYVIEFDSDSQDLVVEGGNVSLVRGETKTLQIVYRKSDNAETRMSADKSESVIDKSDVDALAQSVSLASAIDAFNRGHSAELTAANSPLLTEDELCAALWWHANHVDFSPDPRRSLLEIVLTGRLLPGWSIQLKNVQWDEDKLWHGKPATSRAIEINLVNKEQYIAPIRFQFVSSGLESKVPANSPLADAIAEFNKHEAGDQPPLTLQETLAALSTLWSKEPSRHPEETKLSDDAVSILKQIADQHTMDGHAIESSLQEHEVGDSKFLTWTIKLRVKISDGFLGTQWFLIRKRFIKVESDRILARRSHLQSASDSAKLKFELGLATQDQVLTAELELLEAILKTAEAENAASLPTLLKKREGILQRAFLTAKAKYEAGLMGIEQFSEVVTKLIDAKFSDRIAADGQTKSDLSVSRDDASILLIEEFFVKQKTLGDNHPELLQLRDKILKLKFDHAFDEVGIQKRLIELNGERQQLLRDRSPDHPSLSDNSQRQQTVASLRSGSFPKMLKMLVETDPRRANLLPKEWKGKWVVESATTGDGSPLDIPSPSTLSIFNSTIDWHWGEQAREAYVVNGVNVNGKQSLVDLHWRAVAPNMQGGAATGDVQWLVEYRDNRLWIVRLDQPESPVPDSVDNIRPGHTRFILKRAEHYSLSDDTIQLRKEVEQLKTTVRGFQSQEKQVTHVRQLPFPKEMQGVWRINEAFAGVGEANGRVALAQYENQIVTISDSTMFLQSNVVGNYWYLSRLDSSSSTMQVDLSVRSGSDSVYKTFACLLEIQDNKLYLVRAESPGFPRPQSVQELRRGEKCFVMTRIGDSPMTPEEVIQVAKEKLFEKEDRTVRFKVESVHAPFVLGKPSDGHREGERHLDCRPDPHDFSLDQFLVVLTAECQKKLLSEGVEDITKHFLGKTITAKGPVRGVEYTARAMQGEHFHLIIDDPSKLIIDPSE